MAKNYHVTHRSDDTWSVKAASATRASSTHDTQKAAIDYARKLVQKSGGELCIHGQESSGRIRVTQASHGEKGGIKPSHTFGEIMTRIQSVQDKGYRWSPLETDEPLPKRVGARIERARLMRGHSLRSLAEALGGAFSHTTLQKYEKGDLTPELTTIGALADVLDLRPDYFLKRDSLKLEEVEYRKLTKLGKKDQKQIEEEAFEFFERYLEIEALLSIQSEPLPNFELTQVNVAELGDAIETTAIELRTRWNLGLNPIPNMHTMLEQNGIKVKFLNPRKGFDGISAIAKAGRLQVPTIALSNEFIKDLPRMRFTAIHELAHLVLDLPEMEHRDKERACHRFASAFIIPRARFIEAFGTKRQKVLVAELEMIKAEWGISYGASMKRALDLGLITEGRHKSFCIMSNKCGWRKNGEPLGHWAGEETSYRFKQLVLRALAQDLITTSKACGLLNWSSSKLAAEYQLAG
jgi:Zn-dependent peptidase ImmA (M78 family)/ribosome-binding protein aMBF1 (putative translation factor)